MDLSFQLLPIDGVLIAVGLWILVGAAGMVRPASFFLVARVLFPLGALVSLLVTVADIGMFNIGAAFWGLVAGTLCLWVLRPRQAS